ncbi:hypothetical protein ERJ75_000225400 [Trypanosoma vivax]|nr:hypothetical protein ERJ75_000225400 [Trypanosoma vivax]
MAPKICHAVFFSLDPEKMAANLPGNAVEENLQRLRDTVPGLLEVNMGRAETALFPAMWRAAATTRTALCPSTSMPPRSRRARHTPAKWPSPSCSRRRLRSRLSELTLN